MRPWGWPPVGPEGVVHGCGGARLVARRVRCVVTRWLSRIPRGGSLAVVSGGASWLASLVVLAVACAPVGQDDPRGEAPGVVLGSLFACAGAADCDDADSCTTDRCIGGACVHLPVAAPSCCMVADDCPQLACRAASCLAVPGRPHPSCYYATEHPCCLADGACVDHDPCTLDTCDLDSHSCVHAPTAGCCADDGACDDGDPCTADACDGVTHTCVTAPIAGCCADDGACDDGDPCTVDACDGVTHTCVAAPIAGCCHGSAECTGGAMCVAGVCEPPVHEAGWQQLPAAGLPLTRIRSLARDGSGHLFVAAWGYGVYRSTDGGATFQKLGAPNTVNDPGALAITTVGLNSLGEPVIGVSPSGTGTTTTMLYRFDGAKNAWTTATTNQQMSLGGYFPLAFRHDLSGDLLATWPFRSDIMRSQDGGDTWASAFPIPNAAHTPPNGPSPLVKAVFGVAVHPRSGEMFCGTEGDQWWHSTDDGAAWSMVDEGGTSNLALEPGQNGFLIAFTKDAEPLFGTQGKADGKFLMRLRSDGQVVSSCAGFPVWGMVGTANETTVLRELALTDEGYDFLAMPVADGKGGALPCDLWGSADGATWEKLAAPFVPELNALVADGDSVLVGGGAASPGVIWRYTPVAASRLPLVDTGFAAGESPTCGVGGLALAGSAVDPEGAAVTVSWEARGPGVVTFADPGAAVTSASFGAPGDYVLTLRATDGIRSAGAPVIVHVTP